MKPIKIDPNSCEAIFLTEDGSFFTLQIYGRTTKDRDVQSVAELACRIRGFPDTVRLQTITDVDRNRQCPRY